ncbi:Alkylated DNA repair protein alkB 8 [Dissophora globulifera]|uniref:Alkylated DNA repair protein alkB 8 n=1 Tax=Dissophora globulifera TaxID=979702 RepID=A0A9P6UZY8_9FUNG|nr:Alkylated DNA repair protein alkB 8 [Dissophora globulifera]
MTTTNSSAATASKNPLHIPSPFRADEPDMTPEQKEQQYVHDVYQVIAPHFSATRYKPWPVVEEFLKDMPAGFVGADIGCGNGKYIGVNPKLFVVGSDRSSNLIDICGERGHEAMVCDGLALPYRPEFFDFAISIAVIHHFISPERRVAAIEEMLRVVRVGGRILIFVWALEQTGKRDFDKNVQDVFVPWAMPKKAEPRRDRTRNTAQEGRRRDRVNATSRSGEASLSGSMDQLSIQDGQPSTLSTSNISAPVSMQPALSMSSSSPSSSASAAALAAAEPVSVSASSSLTNADALLTTQESRAENMGQTTAAPVFNRYYHLFHKGELEELVTRTKRAKIVQTGYDRDNWWCIVEKTSHK